jgi:O-antigen ligase
MKSSFFPQTPTKLFARASPYLTLLIFFTVTTAGVFAGGVWSVAAIGGAIVLFAAVWVADRRIPKPSPDLAAMAVIALIVMGLSNIHSTQPYISWFEWQRLGTVFLPLLVFSSAAVQSRAGHPRLFALLPITAAASALMLGIELGSGGVALHALKGQTASLTHYNRGLSYLVILSLPIIAGMISKTRGWGLGAGKKDRAGPWLLAPNFWPIILFILAVFIAVSLTESRGAKLALIVGLMATALAYLWPVFTRRVLMALPMLFIAWPFAVQKFFLIHYEWLKHFPDSWRARMEIWDYMSYRIMERPLFGWGLGTSHMLDFHTPHGAGYVFTTFPASHPHNAVVQLWVELGLPGLALGIGFALLTLRKASRLDRGLAPFALGAWTVALCLCLVSYSLWTDSLFAAFALTGYAFALLEKRQNAAK